MALWLTLLASLWAGVLASLSPCAIFLYPLVLVRFINHSADPSDSECDLEANASNPSSFKKKHNWCELFQFACGFNCSFLLFGFGLRELLTSSIQNGLKLGLGSLCMALFSLKMTNKFSSIALPRVLRSPLLLGFSFAVVLSFNPCVVPFYSLLLHVQPSEALLSMCTFGQGLLIPVFALLFLGQGILDFVSKRTEKALFVVQKVNPFVLGFSGLFMMISTAAFFGHGDVAAAVFIFCACGLALCKTCFAPTSTLTLIILLTIVLWIIGVFSYHDGSVHQQYLNTMNRPLLLSAIRNNDTFDLPAQFEAPAADDSEDITDATDDSEDIDDDIPDSAVGPCIDLTRLRCFGCILFQATYVIFSLSISITTIAHQMVSCDKWKHKWQSFSAKKSPHCFQI
eukprot:TRINITY_DN5192_c0_g1_i1.p1 TRINITY_DN5192_c0_g1~~TRINITY_DN5192_c0_g1_i1.p1  ORF type:complete len:398 (+),score=47.85 TRINITY_DN5192_c0_g1_i1:150-1343(+)